MRPSRYVKEPSGSLAAHVVSHSPPVACAHRKTRSWSGRELSIRIQVSSRVLVTIAPWGTIVTSAAGCTIKSSDTRYRGSMTDRSGFAWTPACDSSRRTYRGATVTGSRTSHPPGTARAMTVTVVRTTTSVSGGMPVRWSVKTSGDSRVTRTAFFPLLNASSYSCSAFPRSVSRVRMVSSPNTATTSVTAASPGSGNR